MLNSAEAKYILSEIRNIDFYSDEINRLQNMYDNIQTEIDSLSAPHSVVTDKPLTGKVSVRDNRNLNEDKLLSLISEQQSIEKNMVKWKNMLSDALRFKKQVCNSEDGDFMLDFLNGNYSYSQLIRRYAVSNPYDYVLRSIRRSVTLY